MKKLRRNICSLIIVIVMLLTICIPSYAASLEVNKENLSKAFGELYSYPFGDGWDIAEDLNLINITDTEVELDLGDEICKFNYEISEDKIIFKKKVSITDGMSYEKFQEETGYLYAPIMGYMAVAKMADVEIENSFMYIFFTIIESAVDSLWTSDTNLDMFYNPYIVVEDEAIIEISGDMQKLTTNGMTIELTNDIKIIKMSEFGKYAVDVTEQTYNDGIIYNDEKNFNTYSLEFKTNRTDKECSVEAVLSVNLNADFSKINEMDYDFDSEGMFDGGIFDEGKFDSGILEDYHNAKISTIENTVKEEITLACSATRLAIAEAIAKDNTYSAKENSKKIQDAILKTLKESELSEADGWAIEKPANDGEDSFEIVYKGEDYKKACKSSEANIKYTIKLGTETIELQKEEKNQGIKDNYGEDETSKHVFTEEIKKQPTCTEKGEALYKCKDCDYKYTKAIPALEHNYVEKSTIESTCSEAGHITYVCSRCFDYYKDPIALGEHNYVERMRTDAECEKDGTIRYICSDCGDPYVKVTQKAKGHKYVETTTNATCTNSGIKTYKCSACEEAYTEVIAKAIGHDYKETVEGNTKKYTCENCGDSYTQEIAKVESENDITQVSDSSIDYNKIIMIAGAVMIGLIVVIGVAMIIIKIRE